MGAFSICAYYCIAASQQRTQSPTMEGSMNATNSVDKLIHVLRAGDAIRCTYIGYIYVLDPYVCYTSIDPSPYKPNQYCHPYIIRRSCHALMHIRAPTGSVRLSSTISSYLTPSSLRSMCKRTYVAIYMLARADQASFRWRRGGDELAQHGNASSPAFVTKTSHSSTLPTCLHF